MSELGELRRAVWESDQARSEEAWRALGLQARADGWARRFLLDVAHGRIALPPESCVPALGEWARDDPEYLLLLVRSAGASVASVVGAGLGQGGCWKAVLRLAKDNAVSIRLAATAGLAELAGAGLADAAEQLAAMLEDPLGEVRWAAAVSLGKARGPVGVSTAIAALQRAVEGRDQSTLSGAAFGAAALYPARKREAVGLLRAAAESGPTGRRAVAAALALAGLPWRAVARFAAALAADPDPAVRCAVAGARAGWARDGGARAFGLLTSLAADSEASVRAAAAEGLGAYAQPEALETRRLLTEDHVGAVRAAAVRALGKLGEREAVRQACRARDPRVRAAACEGVRDRELLLALVDDRDANVARAALAALGREADGPCGPVWKRLLQACEVTTLAQAAAAGMAAALDRDPRGAGEMIWRWPVATTGPELMTTIARRAQHPDVSELARTALHAWTEQESPEALDDLALALADSGRGDLGKASHWLADGARAENAEEIAARAVGAPKFEAVTHLVAVSRSVSRARRAQAGLEAALGRGAETLEAVLAQRVAWRWKEVLAAREEPRRGAELRVTVVSERVLAGVRATALLEVENAGQVAAQGVQVAIQDGDLISIGALPPGAKRHVPVALPGVPPGPIEVQGEVRCRDAAGAHAASFGGSVEAIPPGRIACVDNPYVVGKPLRAGSAMFFGREAEMTFVERALASGESGAVAVLVGQRRIGKTSLLRQLEARLRGSYRPIFIDVQGLLVSGIAAFFVELARRVAGEDDYTVGEEVAESYDSVADMVREAAGTGRRVVLLLDEFDDLEEKVRVGRLNQEVFGQLRNLIQHSPNIGVVLCGTHRLEELAGEYWSFLLNLATYCRIGPLDERAAREVITAPLARLGIACEDAAAWAAAELSGCQPYLLQMLGYRLVEQCVTSGEGSVRFDDVERAADEVVEQGEIHLRYLWESAGAGGRVVLRELARPCRPANELARPAGMGAGEVARTVKTLCDLDLVAEESGHCRLRVGLLGRWLANRGGKER